MRGFFIHGRPDKRCVFVVFIIFYQFIPLRRVHLLDVFGCIIIAFLKQALSSAQRGELILCKMRFVSLYCKMFVNIHII